MPRRLISAAVIPFLWASPASSDPIVTVISSPTTMSVTIDVAPGLGVGRGESIQTWTESVSGAGWDGLELEMQRELTFFREADGVQIPDGSASGWARTVLGPAAGVIAPAGYERVFGAVMSVDDRHYPEGNIFTIAESRIQTEWVLRVGAEPVPFLIHMHDELAGEFSFSLTDLHEGTTTHIGAPWEYLGTLEPLRDYRFSAVGFARSDWADASVMMGLSVQARVVPIPSPSSRALLLIGVPFCLGLMRRRADEPRPIIVSSRQVAVQSP